MLLHVIAVGLKGMDKETTMARKATVTETMILDSAFELMRQEGYEQVTARKLAAKVGCSTQPIFRLYANMDRLMEDVYDRAALFFQRFYETAPKEEKVPFQDLGMAYIRFAREEKNIFGMLFLSKHRGSKSMYELLNGDIRAIGQEVAKAKKMGEKNPADLFAKLWIFIHGIACMSLTGDYDLGEEETYGLLSECYRAFAEKHTEEME